MAAEERIGTELAGHRIDSVLGRGGMGVVYRAEHLRLRRRVAFKVLASELASDQGFQERFVRESQLAASLEHPNIVPIYDAGEIEGLLYLSMRLVEGSDLKELIRREGALDPQRTAGLMGQVGSALDAAHQLGLVHRDVKPQNMLVTMGSRGEERVFLGDFGLTKYAGDSGLTATGTFIGTIDYVAPEQIEGKDVDGRTDVYALGCVAYECLTGVVPYIRDTEIAVIYAHLSDSPPPVTSKRPGLPAAVDRVLDRAMARHVQDRFSTCGDFVAALEAALAAGTAPPAAGTVVAAGPTVVAEAAPAPGAPLSAPQPTGRVDAPHATAQGQSPSVVGPPAARKTALPWVLLAVMVLVALGAGAFFLLSNQDDATETDARRGTTSDASSSPNPSSSPSAPAQGGIVSLRPDSISSSGAADPGIEADGSPITYVAENAIDGDSTTTWRIDGDGIGATLELTYATPVRVARLGLIPGYSKIDPTDGTDRFFENRRVLQVKYTFGDGSSVLQDFREQPVLQFTKVDVTTDSILITITQTTEHGGRDFTPISEIQVKGTET